MPIINKPCEYCGQLFSRRLNSAKNQAFCSVKCYDDSRRGIQKVESPRHGRKLYAIWRGIKERCLNPKADAYERYGGRGITVCAGWIDDYPAFEGWSVSHGYAEGLSIERVDNNGPYAPSNCEFADRITQARNRRSNVHITAFGETKLLKDWSEDPRCTVKRGTFSYRIKRGISPELAMTLPLDPGGGRRPRIVNQSQHSNP